MMLQLDSFFLFLDLTMKYSKVVLWSSCPFRVSKFPNLYDDLQWKG